MIVRSLGQVLAVDNQWSWAPSYASMQMYDRYYYDYQTLYRTQPNVRVCVDFLARNVAQLGLHLYRRISDTDRERVTDHPLARLLGRPNQWTTGYRLIERLMGDLGVYYNAYWLKARLADGLRMIPIPASIVSVQGGLAPQSYEVTLASERQVYAPTEIVHFRGYSADSSVLGLSPLETLRRVLAEEHAMGDYREGFWQNAARMGGVIERPAQTGRDWSVVARERFKAEFEALYSGSENSGRTAILEDGMTWKQVSFNAQESEYLSTRKLTREECARSYHIPLPMVGILDHATFSNIREQHRNLYQDSLGPWLEMIQQEIELQLLPEFADTDGLYLEFNIAAKLAGSFEEQVTALQAAVGRPWMTANEARARMNLPSVPEGDELVTPLNVLVGGQAAVQDSAPPPEPGEGTEKALVSPPALPPPPLPPCTRGSEGGRARRGEDGGAKAEGEIDSTLPGLRKRHVAKWTEVLAAFFRRQERSIRSRIPAEGSAPLIDQVWTDGQRWDKELAGDLYSLNVQTATVWAQYVTDLMGAELVPELMYDFLSVSSRHAATEINLETRAAVERSLNDPAYAEMVGGIFETAATSWSLVLAGTKVTSASNFGAHEGATQGGLRTKTWKVNSMNPRATHAAMDGETVPIREKFSNGMRWPGDVSAGLGAAEVAECECSVVFGR
jgi:HK97 family phage portal protein